MSAKINSRDFYKNEVRPLSSALEGPIDVFVPEDEADIKERALGEGYIEAGAFANCSIFGDSEDAFLQRNARYSLKTSIEIYRLIQREDDAQSIGSQLELLAMEQDLQQAVLIEAARKLKLGATEGTLTPNHEKLYSSLLDEAQANMYPEVDSEIVTYTSGLLIDKIHTNHPEKLDLMIERYPFLACENVERTNFLRQETIEKWNTYLHDTYDVIFQEVYDEMGEPFANSTLAHATELFMCKVGLPIQKDDSLPGWVVEERTDVAGFRIQPQRRRVLCGRRTLEITQARFEQLMCHEVLIHVMRAENGRVKGYSALQTGMPSSQEAEEGLGLLMEKLWAKKPIDEVGRDHYRYMTTAYAAGLLDGKMHSETETLDFITDIIAACRPVNSRDFETNKIEARKAAYDHVKRSFRGMPTGHRMLSNLSYLSGQLKMARYIEESTGDPSRLLAYLQQGKFNPLEQHHTDLLKKIGDDY